jgi:site-specific recombinase XerC
MTYRSSRDLLTVADLLGHASLDTTRRYTEPDGDAAVAAVLAAAAGLGAA